MKRVQNENQTKRLKQNNGITLLALIVTIIVLLILAGVAIASLAGESGVLSKASKAKINTELAEFQEALTLAYAEAVINEYTGGEQVSLLKAIEKVETQGYTVEERIVETETITRVGLSNNSVSVLVGGGTTTVTLTFRTASGESAIKYFAKINGEYYEITQTNDKIKVEETPSDIDNLGSAPIITVNTSDESVATATVEGTTITVISKEKIGTADLNVTVNGTEYSAIGTVTVAELQNFEDLTLDGACLLVPTLTDGTRLTNVQATWSSDNENVATVTDEGIVKCGTETGTAIVSCITDDQTLTCKVTSTAKIVDTNTGTDNRTVNGQEKAYNNPTLPVGFSAIDTAYASWSTTGEQGDINKGLVIMDEQGNQFVWVPVENAIYDPANKAKLPTSEMNGSKTTGYEYTPMAIGEEDMDTGEIDYFGVLYEYDSTEGAYLMYPTTFYYQGTNKQYREPATLSTYDTDTAKPTDGLNTDKTYLEAIGLNAATFKSEMTSNYNEMVESVANYGGFYVGRYESSLIANSTRVVAGATSMNATEETSYRWYGIYARGKEFSTDYVQGSMIWGSQYDAMMNWMVEADIDVTSKTPTTPEGTAASNSSRITGSKAEDKLNNIFDLLGNSYEYTLESYNDGRTSRGMTGAWAGACSRSTGGFPTGTWSGHSLRITFCITQE